MPALFLWRQQAMLARNIASVLRETVGSKDFAPDRTDQLSVAVIAATEKAEKSALGFFGRNYSRRH